MVASIRDGFETAVHFFNRPTIKEGFKNFASTMTFAFGAMEAYDLYQGACDKEISTEKDLESPGWMQVTLKIVLLCAKLSLILSATISRPGVFMISTVLSSIFSTEQLERFFGPNTVFASNPWHPRHVMSIAAIVLALPSVIYFVYRCIRGASTTTYSFQTDQEAWLTDEKVHLMTFLNTATSRPVQHFGNQLCTAILAV